MMEKGPRKNKLVRSGKEIARELLTPPSSRKANGYFILFFFVWAFILYGNTILNKYGVDDEFVTNNETVRKGLAAIPEIFTTHYINQTGNVGDNTADYRPVVKLTYALEYQIFQGENPGRSHAINVLIYIFISILLFFILKRILKNYNILFLFLITVVFMAHPVHTEVVASLKNRDEMLAFLCGLGALSLILRYAERRKLWYVLLALLVFFTGYLSKASILPFVLIYPLVLYFFTDLSPKRYIPISIAMVAVAIIAQIGPDLFLPAGERLASAIENPLYAEDGFLYRVGTGLLSLLFYVRILIYPHPLLFYYGNEMIPLTTPGNIWAIISFVLYTGLLLYAISTFNKKHILSFAIFWYLIFIAMYSNLLIPVMGIVAERFVFAASLGFCIALVWIVFKIFRTEPNSLTIEFDARAKILVVVILILIPYAAVTITRNREWRNLLDLYRKDIPYLENSAKANTQYAGYLMQTTFRDPNFLKHGNVNEFKLDVIKKHFHRSLEIFPDNYQTMNDLGTVYLFLGKDPDSAIIYLKRAIALNDHLEPAWVNLGMAFREMKRYDSAAWCYSTILRRNPSHIRAYFALANVYNDMGHINRAIDMNNEVLKSNPNLDMPFINIGNYLLLTGDTAMAILNYEEAIKRRLTFEGCIHLSNLYKDLGDMQKSDYYLQRSSEALKRNQR